MFRNTFQSGVISILNAHGSHPLQLWDSSLDDDTGRVRRRTPSPASVGGSSIEISGTNLSQNYIICPSQQQQQNTCRPSLAITIPYLYLTIYVPNQSNFALEVTILDDTQTIRRFHTSTYHSTTIIKPDIAAFPMKLESQGTKLTRDELLLRPPAEKKQKRNVVDTNNTNSYYGPGNSDEEEASNSNRTTPCWNRICVPLSEYTRLAYGTNYVETIHVQINSNKCQIKRVYFAEKEMNEDDELPEEFRLYYHPA